MIEALDDTLAWLFRVRSEPGSLLQQAAISFEMPDTEWRSRINRLTLCCYLYDVRENKSLRTNDPLVARGPDGRFLTQPPPPRIDCTYCITAWNPRGDTSAINSGDAVRFEHRLLSQALALLLRHPQVERNTLADPDGGARRAPPHPTRISSVDEQRGMSEFWTALGQQPKPSLNFVLTMAIPVQEATASSPRVQHVELRGEIQDPHPHPRSPEEPA